MSGRITFTRSESWKDYRGIHSVTIIRSGKERIGEISGESGCGIPVMRYSVKCAGMAEFATGTLKAAKDQVRDLLDARTA